MKNEIADIDFQSNLVFDENGEVYCIESYIDEFENPCLPEEAIALYYIKNDSFIKYYLTEYDLEIVNNVFDSY